MQEVFHVARVFMFFALLILFFQTVGSCYINYKFIFDIYYIFVFHIGKQNLKIKKFFLSFFKMY